MKNKFKITVLALVSLLFIVSCNDVLDKKNLSAVEPEQVWSNANTATTYLNQIYAELMPGNTDGTGSDTDEGVPYTRQTNDWMRGTATFDTYKEGMKGYSSIRSVNFLLDNLNKATFAQADKDKLKGQALFWRAWAYHAMVNKFGGVPLVLEAQQPVDDLTKLQKPRNKTSECVAQILKDLDNALALLPDAFVEDDFGRIDKGVVLAFKGRVLLFYASPLFNGLGGVASWQKAYDANKAAKDFLDARGKDLYTPFSKIWDHENNKEAVMVRRFNYPQTVYSQAGVMPIFFSKDDVGKDRPSLELVNAFPMKDGSAWDPATMDYGRLFMNRDERFYATIYYNGAPNQYLKGMREQKTYLWVYYNSIEDYNGQEGIKGAHNKITFEGLPTSSGFYRIKAVDKTIDKNTPHNAALDWIEIRYAEVIMNLGECANEIGKTNEALEVLKRIRERAEIEPGADGNYGIKAASQADMREACKKERFVEFCFEGKRWDDLRRWKMFDYLNKLPQRHGLAILLKPDKPDVSPLSDINEIWDNFTYTVVATDANDIALENKYYIYGIPKIILDRNPLFKQNKGWGGSFDPLQ